MSTSLSKVRKLRSVTNLQSCRMATLKFIKDVSYENIPQPCSPVGGGAGGAGPCPGRRGFISDQLVPVPPRGGGGRRRSKSRAPPERFLPVLRPGDRHGPCADRARH